MRRGIGICGWPERFSIARSVEQRSLQNPARSQIELPIPDPNRLLVHPGTRPATNSRLDATTVGSCYESCLMRFVIRECPRPDSRSMGLGHIKTPWSFHSKRILGPHSGTNAGRSRCISRLRRVLNLGRASVLQAPRARTYTLGTYCTKDIPVHRLFSAIFAPACAKNHETAPATTPLLGLSALSRPWRDMIVHARSFYSPGMCTLHNIPSASTGRGCFCVRAIGATLGILLGHLISWCLELFARRYLRKLSSYRPCT